MYWSLLSCLYSNEILSILFFQTRAGVPRTTESHENKIVTLRLLHSKSQYFLHSSTMVIKSALTAMGYTCSFICSQSLIKHLFYGLFQEMQSKLCKSLAGLQTSQIHIVSEQNCRNFLGSQEVALLQNESSHQPTELKIF